ncbi:uncharacterized protein DUF3331 [Paraburkholderia sp. BL6669N2]|nr:uncharacterized protein DUF3331 [Paraburkholderia sp. BL6669N2]
MDSVIGSLDAWRIILDELRAVTGAFAGDSPSAVDADSRGRAHRDVARCVGTSTKAWECNTVTQANVEIVEWSERSLTIVWHDPTACSYVDQRWSRSKSTSSGVCALSGAIISRGQDIFKPSRSKPPPVNADAMILLSALPALAAE